MDSKKLPLLVTLVLAVSAASPAPTGLNPGGPSSCTSQMDGQLPSYVPPGFNFSGTVRRYFLAAEIVPWDYTPSGWDNMLGVPIQHSFRAQQMALIGPNLIGTKMDKALYRGYTDASYTQRTQQPDWLGMQGPIIRAELGDMIEVMLFNKMSPYYVSLHSMGLFYTKRSEGALYWKGNNVSASPGDAIPPGGCFVYKWLVGNASAPTPGFDSRLFSYHSYVSFYEDTNAGLSGPVIVYNSGKMQSVMSSNREFILMYSTLDESRSFLSNYNLQKYLPATYQSLLNTGSFTSTLGSSVADLPAENRTFWYPSSVNAPNSPATNAMLPVFYSINGFLYANNPPFEMCDNETALWYMYNVGLSMHAVHWHGHNVNYGGVSHVVVPLDPGQAITGSMDVSSGAPGVWEVICHVIDHQNSGMVANYIVHTAQDCPLSALAG